MLHHQTSSNLILLHSSSRRHVSHKTKKETRTAKGSHPRLPTVANAVEFRPSPPPPKAAGIPPLAYIIARCHHVSVTMKLRRRQLLLPLDPSSNSSEQQENEAVEATVDRHYIPPPMQSATIALLPLSKYEVLIPSSSSNFIQKLTQIKFLLGLNSSHRIPASGSVGGDWWGLPTTTTTASSGSTATSLLLSSQYNGDRIGKKEQGLGFVWGCSDQQKRKRDGVGGIIYICEVRRGAECPSHYENGLNVSDLDEQRVSSNLFGSSNLTLTNNQREKAVQKQNYIDVYTSL
ncbi:unnamed protein product [Lactuca saligna]|uniref:Uncharacterized protein n=1 Tax=Lactuca saligna TaxID=75948 RepID=A0AA35YBT9_LACSI|nr:unnamed protein product [Lactuca saligna]